MSHRTLNRSLAKAAIDAGDAATHAAVTIAARLPILTTGLVAPTAASMAEWNRAWAEKVAATWEGAMAASLAWQTAMIRSAFRPPTPTSFANDCVRVAGIGLRPARRQVKANAKRLSRR